MFMQVELLTMLVPSKRTYSSEAINSFKNATIAALFLPKSFKNVEIAALESERSPYNSDR